jgi:hypothetical protein
MGVSLRKSIGNPVALISVDKSNRTGEIRQSVLVSLSVAARPHGAGLYGAFAPQ